MLLLLEGTRWTRRGGTVICSRPALLLMLMMNYCKVIRQICARENFPGKISAQKGRKKGRLYGTRRRRKGGRDAHSQSEVP